MKWPQDIQTVGKRLLSSVVGRNVLSLYGLQIANYAFPLMTVPYLVRVLGPDRFGVVAFGQGLMGYLVILVKYGFDWSATRTISTQHGDEKAVAHTVSAVWAAEALFCIGGFLALLAATFVIPRVAENQTLLLLLYGIVIGNALFPSWYFQGVERMEAITVINGGVRVFGVACIFLFVQQEADYLVYAGILSGQWVISGLISVLAVTKFFGVGVRLPSLLRLKSVISEGWTLFVSHGAVSLYTAGNAFILGLLASNSAVGYYSAAEKVIRAVKRFLKPISRAVFPRASEIAKSSRRKALRWGGRFLAILGTVGGSLSLGLFFGAPFISGLLLGDGFVESVSVLRWMAAIPFLVAISNVLGLQIMLPFEHDNAFMVIVLIAGVVNLTVAIFLSPLWEEDAMAAAVLCAEATVSILMFFYLKRKNLIPKLIYPF